jgi:hypothetical protein
MQNAHERFGMLEVRKHMKDTSTRVRVHKSFVAPETPNFKLGEEACYYAPAIKMALAACVLPERSGRPAMGPRRGRKRMPPSPS